MSMKEAFQVEGLETEACFMCSKHRRDQWDGKETREMVRLIGDEASKGFGDSKHKRSCK